MIITIFFRVKMVNNKLLTNKIARRPLIVITPRRIICVFANALRFFFICKNHRSIHSFIKWRRFFFFFIYPPRIVCYFRRRDKHSYNSISPHVIISSLNITATIVFGSCTVDCLYIYTSSYGRNILCIGRILFCNDQSTRRTEHFKIERHLRNPNVLGRLIHQ